MQQQPDEIFTVSEAAARLKIKPDTLREWIYTDQIRAYRLGTRWRIKAADLEALLQPKRAEG